MWNTASWKRHQLSSTFSFNCIYVCIFSWFWFRFCNFITLYICLLKHPESDEFALTSGQCQECHFYKGFRKKVVLPLSLSLPFSFSQHQTQVVVADGLLASSQFCLRFLSVKRKFFTCPCCQKLARGGLSKTVSSRPALYEKCPETAYAVICYINKTDLFKCSFSTLTESSPFMYCIQSISIMLRCIFWGFQLCDT